MIDWMFLTLFFLPLYAAPTLTEARAKEIVTLSLHCVDQEYPNLTSDTLEDPKSIAKPHGLHPAFYGCFDWHSAVHGHWAMARVLKLFPNIDVKNEIEFKLDAHLKPEFILKELAYFNGPDGGSWERPYGYAWLLRLALELKTLKHPKAHGWSQALLPLEEELIKRFVSYLGKFNYPVRHGVHGNTAFAMAHFWDYAVGAGRTDLQTLIRDSAKKYFLKDRACPIAYEPSGGDFISGCLAETDLMHRVLERPAFEKWLRTFLPDLDRNLTGFLNPPLPSDPKDYVVGHLIGLSFYKASVLNRIAGKKPALTKSAQTHLSEGLRLMFESGYGGAHWLASFALFAAGGSN